MSQNKTRFPGMENTGNNPYNRDAYSSNSDKGQSQNRKSNEKSTRFPGMESVQEGQKHQSDDQHDPIVGFLFSVSRTPFGEYWPLYLGPNKIGRKASNSVNLQEGSVSGEHANLVIEQYTNPNVTIAVLENKGSKNGTFINGKPVFYGRTEECKNGDILRFGSSYECMLLLFDVRELGLKKADGFMSVEVEEETDEWNDWDDDAPYKRHDTDNDTPYFDPGTKKGTTPMNGGKAFGSGKPETEYM